jgi:hypothetical protein
MAEQPDEEEVNYPKRTPINTGLNYARMDLVEVGDQVAYYTKGMSPIRVKDSEIGLYPYEARQVAELLLRPNAQDIGEQLLRAVDLMEESG